MILPITSMQALIDELTVVLDRQIALLETKCRQFEELSAVILQRDNAAMESLLERIEQTERETSSADARMGVIRGAIAAALRRPEDEVRLSRILPHLPHEQAAAVDIRRRRIVKLVEQLRRGQMDTSLLLREAQRINQMLLESILSGGQTLTTYAAGGRDVWRAQGGLLDTER